MISGGSSKIESAENDPDALARLLELELIQKRAGLKQANARYRSVRMLGWFIIFVLVAGLIAAFVFGFSKLNQHRAQPSQVHPVTPKR